jgi:hypothetical protein
MAVTAKFQADFSDFNRAVESAELTLRGFETGAAKVEKSLNRMGDSFSGRKVIQDATLAADAIEKMGGALNLTEKEQREVNALVTEALAKYRALGIEAPKAVTDLANATAKVPEKMSLAERGANALKSTFGQMFSAFAAANLVERGVTALVNWGKEAVEAAGATLDLANKTGLSTDTIQRMAYVAKQTGSDVETFTRAAFMLGVNVEKGQGAIEGLGLSFEQLRRMQPDQQFVAVVKALEDMEDPQERNRIAVQLFGKAAQEILPSIAEGYTQIAESATVAERAQLEAVDRATDAWDAFVQNFKTSVAAFLGDQVRIRQVPERLQDEFRELASQGLSTSEILKELFPPDVNLAADKVTNDVKNVNSTLFNLGSVVVPKTKTELKKLDDVNKSIFAGMRKLGEAVEFNNKALGNANDELAKAVRSQSEHRELLPLVIEDYSNWREQLVHVTESINKLGPGLGTVNDQLAKQQEEIRKFIGQAEQAFAKELDAGLDFGKRLADSIMGAFQGGGDVAKSIGAFLGNEIGEELGKTLAKKLASVLGEKIGGAIGGLLGPLGAIGGSLLGGLFDKMFSKAGRDAVEAFADQFGGFDALRTKLNDLGAEGERLWVNLTQRVGRGNVQQAESAIAAIEKALEAHKSAVSKAEQESAAATQKATDAHKAAIDQVKARISDLDSEYNSLYNTIKNEAPEDEMGIIERNTRAEMDRIRRERETAQTELERITGAMEDSFEKVAEAAEEAARKMIEAFGEVGIRTPGGTGSFEVPELATGGIVKRPTLALIGEKGPEAVVPLDSWNSSDSVQPLVINLSAGVYDSRQIVLDIVNKEFRLRQQQVSAA